MDQVNIRCSDILRESGVLFASKGIESASVREIAKCVGLRPASIYHYFSSKDAIAEEIVLAYLNELTSSYKSQLPSATGSRNRLRQVIRTSLDVTSIHSSAAIIYQNHLNQLSGMARGSEIAGLGDEIAKIWREIINAGVAQGDFRQDINAQLFYRLLRDAVFLTPRWYRPRPQLGNRHAELTELLLAVFLDGFSVDE